jgi:hypothetical protein
MTYSGQRIKSTSYSGRSTASGGVTWWERAESRQDERERRERAAQRAKDWPAIRTARPGHMIAREQTRERVTARINELFPNGTYAARG